MNYSYILKAGFIFLITLFLSAHGQISQELSINKDYTTFSGASLAHASSYFASTKNEVVFSNTLAINYPATASKFYILFPQSVGVIRNIVPVRATPISKLCKYTILQNFVTVQTHSSSSIMSGTCFGQFYYTSEAIPSDRTLYVSLDKSFDSKSHILSYDLPTHETASRIEMDIQFDSNRPTQIYNSIATVNFSFKNMGLPDDAVVYVAPSWSTYAATSIDFNPLTNCTIPGTRDKVKYTDSKLPYKKPILHFTSDRSSLASGSFNSIISPLPATETVTCTMKTMFKSSGSIKYIYLFYNGGYYFFHYYSDFKMYNGAMSVKQLAHNKPITSELSNMIIDDLTPYSGFDLNDEFIDQNNPDIPHFKAHLAQFNITYDEYIAKHKEMKKKKETYLNNLKTIQTKDEDPFFTTYNVASHHVDDDHPENRDDQASSMAQTSTSFSPQAAVSVLSVGQDSTRFDYTTAEHIEDIPPHNTPTPIMFQGYVPIVQNEEIHINYDPLTTILGTSGSCISTTFGSNNAVTEEIPLFIVSIRDNNRIVLTGAGNYNSHLAPPYTQFVQCYFYIRIAPFYTLTSGYISYPLLAATSSTKALFVYNSDMSIQFESNHSILPNTPELIRMNLNVPAYIDLKYVNKGKYQAIIQGRYASSEPYKGKQDNLDFDSECKYNDKTVATVFYVSDTYNLNTNTTEIVYDIQLADNLPFQGRNLFCDISLSTNHVSSVNDVIMLSRVRSLFFKGGFSFKPLHVINQAVANYGTNVFAQYIVTVSAPPVEGILLQGVAFHNSHNIHDVVVIERGPQTDNEKCKIEFAPSSKLSSTSIPKDYVEYIFTLPSDCDFFDYITFGVQGQLTINDARPVYISETVKFMFTDKNGNAKTPLAVLTGPDIPAIDDGHGVDMNTHRNTLPSINVYHCNNVDNIISYYTECVYAISIDFTNVRGFVSNNLAYKGQFAPKNFDYTKPFVIQCETDLSSDVFNPKLDISISSTSNDVYWVLTNDVPSNPDAPNPDALVNAKCNIKGLVPTFVEHEIFFNPISYTVSRNFYSNTDVLTFKSNAKNLVNMPKHMGYPAFAVTTITSYIYYAQTYQWQILMMENLVKLTRKFDILFSLKFEMDKVNGIYDCYGKDKDGNTNVLMTCSQIKPHTDRVSCVIHDTVKKYVANDFPPPLPANTKYYACVMNTIFIKPPEVLQYHIDMYLSADIPALGVTLFQNSVLAREMQFDSPKMFIHPTSILTSQSLATTAQSENAKAVSADDYDEKNTNTITTITLETITRFTFDIYTKQPIQNEFLLVRINEGDILATSASCISTDNVAVAKLTNHVDNLGRHLKFIYTADAPKYYNLHRITCTMDLYISLKNSGIKADNTPQTSLTLSFIDGSTQIFTKPLTCAVAVFSAQGSHFAPGTRNNKLHITTNSLAVNPGPNMSLEGIKFADRNYDADMLIQGGGMDFVRIKSSNPTNGKYTYNHALVAGATIMFNPNVDSTVGTLVNHPYVDNPTVSMAYISSTFKNILRYIFIPLMTRFPTVTPTIKLIDRPALMHGDLVSFELYVPTITTHFTNLTSYHNSDPIVAFTMGATMTDVEMKCNIENKPYTITNTLTNPVPGSTLFTIDLAVSPILHKAVPLHCTFSGVLTGPTPHNTVLSLTDFSVTNGEVVSSSPGQFTTIPYMKEPELFTSVVPNNNLFAGRNIKVVYSFRNLPIYGTKLLTIDTPNAFAAPNPSDPAKDVCVSNQKELIITVKPQTTHTFSLTVGLKTDAQIVIDKTYVIECQLDVTKTPSNPLTDPTKFAASAISGPHLQSPPIKSVIGPVLPPISSMIHVIKELQVPQFKGPITALILTIVVTEHVESELTVIFPDHYYLNYSNHCVNDSSNPAGVSISGNIPGTLKIMGPLPTESAKYICTIAIPLMMNNCIGCSNQKNSPIFKFVHDTRDPTKFTEIPFPDVRDRYPAILPDEHISGNQVNMIIQNINEDHMLYFGNVWKNPIGHFLPLVAIVGQNEMEIGICTITPAKPDYYEVEFYPQYIRKDTKEIDGKNQTLLFFPDISDIILKVSSTTHLKTILDGQIAIHVTHADTGLSVLEDQYIQYTLIGKINLLPNNPVLHDDVMETSFVFDISTSDDYTVVLDYGAFQNARYLNCSTKSIYPVDVVNNNDGTLTIVPIYISYGNLHSVLQLSVFCFFHIDSKSYHLQYNPMTHTFDNKSIWSFYTLSLFRDDIHEITKQVNIPGTFYHQPSRMVNLPSFSIGFLTDKPFPGLTLNNIGTTVINVVTKQFPLLGESTLGVWNQTVVHYVDEYMYRGELVQVPINTTLYVNFFLKNISLIIEISDISDAVSGFFNSHDGTSLLSSLPSPSSLSLSPSLVNNPPTLEAQKPPRKYEDVTEEAVDNFSPQVLKAISKIIPYPAIYRPVYNASVAYECLIPGRCGVSCGLCDQGLPCNDDQDCLSDHCKTIVINPGQADQSMVQLCVEPRTDSGDNSGVGYYSPLSSPLGLVGYIAIVLLSLIVF